MISCGKINTHHKFDEQAEELIAYLEKGGVMESLTRVLGDLKVMEKRPNNPMAYIIQNLGGKYTRTTPMHENIIKELIIKIITLERENQVYRDHVEGLEKKVDGLLAQLDEEEDDDNCHEEYDEDVVNDDDDEKFSRARRTESSPTPSPDMSSDEQDA